MKKVLLTILGIVLIAGLSSFFIFNKPKSDLKKVKVAEVTHSLFYTPQYVAHSLGYFKEEGLDVELILVPGADKVAAAVLSNDVDIGFSGTEATIYVYNQGEKDYLVVFSGLTKRDGTFLVSRKKYDNFKLEDLKGSYIIGGRKGGMPEMTFEWALKQNGIDPKKDVNIDTSIALQMAGAFVGNRRFCNSFEPQALQVENQGFGYVVASMVNWRSAIYIYYARKAILKMKI